MADRCQVLLTTVAVVTAIIAFFGLLISAIVADIRNLSPEYSMAITGVAGLDLDHPTLSPVFNLTLGISNIGDRHWACVPGLSTASVSYGDAFLGKGSVGPLCAEPNGEREGQARAWGQDVVVPRFLRDQLAGELRRGDAAVDVALKMPIGCNAMSCFDKVVLCKAKIRGGTPCLMWVGGVQSQHSP